MLPVNFPHDSVTTADLLAYHTLQVVERFQSDVAPLPLNHPIPRWGIHAYRRWAEEHAGIELGECSSDLPDFLKGTNSHPNCPNHYVPIVRILLAKTERIVAFRGACTETGNILFSILREFGYSPSVHLIPPDRVQPVLPKSVSLGDSHVDR